MRYLTTEQIFILLGLVAICVALIMATIYIEITRRRHREIELQSHGEDITGMAERGEPWRDEYPNELAASLDAYFDEDEDRYE